VEWYFSFIAVKVTCGEAISSMRIRQEDHNNEPMSWRLHPFIGAQVSDVVFVFGRTNESKSHNNGAVFGLTTSRFLSTIYFCGRRFSPLLERAQVLVGCESAKREKFLLAGDCWRQVLYRRAGGHGKQRTNLRDRRGGTPGGPCATFLA